MKALSGRDLPIICKSVFEGTDVLQNPTANKPIGTGPFKFVQWERGPVRAARPQRRNTGSRGLPYLNRIVARFIPDAATRSAAMETGEAHFAGYSAVNYADLARMKTNPILGMTTKGYEMTPALSVLELNEQPSAAGQEGGASGDRLCHRPQRHPATTSCTAMASPPPGRSAASSRRPASTPTTSASYDVPDRLRDRQQAAGRRRRAAQGADGMRFALHLEVNSFGEQWLRQAEYLKQALARSAST